MDSEMVLKFAKKDGYGVIRETWICVRCLMRNADMKENPMSGRQDSLFSSKLHRKLLQTML